MSQQQQQQQQQLHHMRSSASLDEQYGYSDNQDQEQDQPEQNSPYIRRRGANRSNPSQIDSAPSGSFRSLDNSLYIGAIPETAYTSKTNEMRGLEEAGGGPGEPNNNRTGGPPLPPSKMVRLKRSMWRWVLHFVMVMVLTIIVIMLLVAVGIPVTDNGVPPAADYTKMEFDWHINPRSYLTPFNSSFDYNILLDAHLHTTYSDGVLSPKQAIEYSIANGFDAIIVTDHQTVAGSLAAKKYAEEHYKDQITIITGMEYTCCRIHMNLIGISESVPVHPPFPSDEELRSVIDKVHSMGGMVMVNHIPWSNTTLLPWDEPRLLHHPTRQQLYDWGVDGFEVVNQGVFDLRSYQFIQEHPDSLVAVTGSDMHRPGPSYAWTAINAPNRTAEAILNEIRNRRTSFLLDASGTRPVLDPPYSKEYFKYAPWGLVGDYFYGYFDIYKGMYSFQGPFCQKEIVDIHHSMIGWFFLWLIVSVVILEILYWFFRWLILLIVGKIANIWRNRRQ